MTTIIFMDPVLQPIHDLVSVHVISDVARIIAEYVPDHPTVFLAGEGYISWINVGWVVLGKRYGYWDYWDCHGDRIECSYWNGYEHGAETIWHEGKYVSCVRTFVHGKVRDVKYFLNTILDTTHTVV
jgi:hypothetical protein